ncbi:PQQ-binding-like beta-propeller repeat protein [Lysobacter korlensis]|uniref:PQQ-binding-like beta-propeller repeat protein n=1 Tax=Lysobacter korlensis TaxID=553636 RepID=A0ABV6RXY4_9GAMM
MRSDDDLGDPEAPGASAPGATPTVPAAGAQPPSVRRRRSVAPAVVLPLLLAVLAGSLFVVDRSAPALAGGDAARFVPPDGHAARYQDADGTVDAVENARLIGVEGLFTAPDAVASAVLGSLGEAGVTGAQLWRETLTTADGSQYSDLYLLDDSGISEVAAWGGPVGFTFEPALLLMPAGAAAGDEWSSSGSAFGDGVLTYRAEYRASEPPASMETAAGGRLKIAQDCLQVDGSLLVEEPESGPLLESTGTSIWCPGEGRVLTTGEQNGEPVTSAVTDPSAPLAPAAPAADPAAPEDAPAVQPGDVTPLDAVAVDPFFGESVKQGAVTIPPAHSDAGLVLVANDRGDDLHAWRLGPSRATLEWAAHPGGVIVGVAAVGDLVLAATSERAVHAYDALGRRLWTWRGDELALAPPRSASTAGSNPLVATRDGRVALLAAEDGAEQWSADLGADTRGGFVIAGTVVVLADERGRLSGLDIATGELRWRQDAGMIEALSAAADGTAVYAATFDNELLAIDPASGEVRWDDGFAGILRSMTVTPAGVVLATDEETVGYDADGAEVWAAAGGGGLPIVGEAPEAGATVSLRDRRAALRSADGEDAGEWHLPDEATVEGGHVIRDGSDVVLVDSFLLFWRMEGR